MAVKATVISTTKNRVSINNTQRAKVRTIAITPSSNVNALRNLSDVDATSLANNNTLVYDSASDKFIVKELPVINGGTF